MSEEKQAEMAKKLAGMATENGGAPAKKQAKEEKKEERSELRKISILALGDGGCTIASVVKSAAKEDELKALKTVGFNLSGRNKDLFVGSLDRFSYVLDEDGSGKNRAISKDEVGKNHISDPLINDVMYGSDIILVKGTTGGGTGSGSAPTMAMKIENALIDNNQDAFTMILGVAPKLEDYPEIYNTISWIKEVEKVELPYLLFNNDRIEGTLPVIHKTVNEEIVKSFKVLMGTSFKSSGISSCDSKDVITALNRSGRVNIYYSSDMPGNSETADQFMQKVIDKSSQEEPRNPHARVVFVKGPKEVIDRFNTSLPEISAKYGNPTIRYTHVEESDDVEIAMITAGSTLPLNLLTRLNDVKTEMEYVDRKRKEEKGKLDINVDNPFEGKRTKKSL